MYNLVDVLIFFYNVDFPGTKLDDSGLSKYEALHKEMSVKNMHKWFIAFPVLFELLKWTVIIYAFLRRGISLSIVTFGKGNPARDINSMKSTLHLHIFN